MRATLDSILDATLKYYGMEYKEWKALQRCRESRYVEIKRAVSHIASDLHYRCTEIARFLNISHTSVQYHVVTSKDFYDTYADYRLAINLIHLEILHRTGCVFEGWVARNKNDSLTIATNKPEKICGFWIAEGSKLLPCNDGFTEVTQENSPKKICIKIELDQDGENT